MCPVKKNSNVQFTKKHIITKETFNRLPNFLILSSSKVESNTVLQKALLSQYLQELS